MDIALVEDATDAVLQQCIRRLEGWTATKHGRVVYDSRVDPFTAHGLFTAVCQKPNIAIVGFTTEGDVFGGFYSVAVFDTCLFFHDPHLFAFSFVRDGPTLTASKFTLKAVYEKNAFVFFLENSTNGFVYFHGGKGGFFLGGPKSDSYCQDMATTFEGLDEERFRVKPGSPTGPYYYCQMLVAVQFSDVD